MLKLKSVASALVLVASAADLAAPVLVAPAVVLAASTAAHAQDAAVRQEVVRFGDLNLATAEGQASLRTRLKGAVAMVCGPKADLRNFDEAADYKACVARASQEALSQVRQQASRPAAHAG